MEVGDWVLAIGSPFGLDTTVTSGIISAKGRGVRASTNAKTICKPMPPSTPATAAARCLTCDGEVIGINTAISSRGGGNDGIGFAIPINMAKWVANQLIKHGEVSRGYLGVMIQNLNGPLAKKLNVTADAGALVAQVLADSPAAKAGLKPGDVVLSLEGDSISSPKSLQDAVEKLEVGKKYKMEIQRNGEKQSLAVTIEKMPSSDVVAKATESDSAEHAYKNLGLDVQELNSALRSKLNLKDVAGVVVSRVEDNSPADNAGLKVGDVIEKVGSMKVATPDDFKAAIEKSPLEDGILLLVHSQGGTRFVVLQ